MPASDLQVRGLCGDRARFDDQPAHTDRQSEPPRPSTARVEIKHAILPLLLRLMAVPVNHDRKSRRLRFQVQLLQNVEHVNRNALDLHQLCQRNVARPSSVDIFADGGRRRDFFELVQDRA